MVLKGPRQTRPGTTPTNPPISFQRSSQGSPQDSLQRYQFLSHFSVINHPIFYSVLTSKSPPNLRLFLYWKGQFRHRSCTGFGL